MRRTLPAILPALLLLFAAAPAHAQKKKTADLKAPEPGYVFPPGGKAGIHLEPLVACLSRKAGGRPVRLQATREEEFSLLPCRSALTYRIKTGVRSDGRITAQQMTMFWDAGAYADYAVNVTRASGFSASGPYELPNATVDAYTIYTNKPYGTAYRGFGHVEFFWGLERHMELVAQAIGMDSLEFRRRNLLKPGSLTMTGEVITENTGDPLACLEAAATSIDYGRLTPEEAEHHPMGHVLSRAVGTQESLELDAISDTAVTKDVFLLCSDGLHGVGRAEQERLCWRGGLKRHRLGHRCSSR